MAAVELSNFNPFEAFLPGTSDKAAAGKKRRRITTRCTRCREKHQKCDGGRPCSECAKKSFECHYPEPRKRGPKSSTKSKKKASSSTASPSDDWFYTASSGGVTTTMPTSESLWRSKQLAVAHNLNRYGDVYHNHFHAMFPLINSTILHPSAGGNSILAAINDESRPGRRLEIAAALTLAAYTVGDTGAVTDLNETCRTLVKEAITSPSADMANGLHLLSLSNICSEDPLYPVLLLSTGEAMLQYYDLGSTDFQATNDFARAAIHFSTENFEALCNAGNGYASWPRRPIGVSFLALVHLADGTRDMSTINVPMVLSALDEYSTDIELIPSAWGRVIAHITAMSMRSLLFWRHGHTPMAIEWARKAIQWMHDPGFDMIPIFMAMFPVMHLAHMFYVDNDVDSLRLCGDKMRKHLGVCRPVAHFYESYLIPRLRTLIHDTGSNSGEDPTVRESFLLHKIPIVKAKSHANKVPDGRALGNINFASSADTVHDPKQLIANDPWPCDHLNDVVLRTVIPEKVFAGSCDPSPSSQDSLCMDAVLSHASHCASLVPTDSSVSNSPVDHAPPSITTGSSHHHLPQSPLVPNSPSASNSSPLVPEEPPSNSMALFELLADDLMHIPEVNPEVTQLGNWPM